MAKKAPFGAFFDGAQDQQVGVNDARWFEINNGARDRNRTGTPVIHEAADFKSDVSTYFTTRAWAVTR